MFFNSRSKDRSLLKVYSFYQSNIHPDIPKYQKMVFDAMGISINQVKKDRLNHARFLNYIGRDVVDTDFLVFFDIDCIPTSRAWLPKLLNDVLVENYPFVGAAQTANHLQDAKNLYISPFFCCISTKLLKELGYPEAHSTEKWDVWQNITEVALSQSVSMKYWWPTEIEDQVWYLHHPEHNKFGLGTTYEDAIYHAFFSRSDTPDRFVNKCKSVLQVIRGEV